MLLGSIPLLVESSWSNVYVGNSLFGISVCMLSGACVSLRLDCGRQWSAGVRLILGALGLACVARGCMCMWWNGCCVAQQAVSADGLEGMRDCCCLWADGGVCITAQCDAGVALCTASPEWVLVCRRTAALCLQPVAVQFSAFLLTRARTPGICTGADPVDGSMPLYSADVSGCAWSGAMFVCVHCGVMHGGDVR